ncbi:MAG: TonB-dependent receptor [Alphaproteobacteria bacterium]
MKINSNVYKYGISGLAILAVMAPVVQAQNMDEIIVTARKQSESLLEVPVAVTAFSEADIEDIDLNDISNLASFTPGFQYEPFGTTVGRFDNSPTFRAVTTNSAEPTRQTASVFVDGVYITNGVQGIDFNDIERIEAIKGPQSAVFGRATFGGALNFITKTPGDEVEGGVHTTATSRGLYEVGGSFEGPVAGDWLKGRVSANLRDKRGHYKSTFDGGRVGDEQTWSVTGTAFIEEGDNFDAKIRVNYFENEDGAPAAAFVGQNLLNCGPTALETDSRFPGIVAGQQGPLNVTANQNTAPFFCGELPVPASNLPTELPGSIRTALENSLSINGDGERRSSEGFGLDRQAFSASGQFNLRFDNGMVLSSLTGYGYNELDTLRTGEFNTGVGSGPLYYAPYARQFRDFSQEFRLSGDAFEDRLDWSIGVNYVEQLLRDNSGFGLYGSGFLFSSNGAEISERGADTLGIFASVNYQLSDSISLTGEGRYQVDKVIDATDIETDDPSRFQNKFKNFLPRAILEYTPSDNTLIYLSYSEGNLPGGFNSNFASRSDEDRRRIQAAQPFSSDTTEEEELINYEVGVKQRFNNGSLSAAFYYLDRTNQVTRDSTQVQLENDPVGVPSFVSQFLNVGRSEVYGLELEGNYRLNDKLSVDGTLAYVESEYKEFSSVNALDVFGVASVSGNISERFPKLSGSFSWTYADELNEDWNWFFRNDNTYSSKRYASELNLAWAAPALVSNARLGMSNETYRFELFVTNLTDETSPTAAFRSVDLSSTAARNVGRSSPFQFYLAQRDRREFGARLSAKF